MEPVGHEKGQILHQPLSHLEGSDGNLCPEGDLEGVSIFEGCVCALVLGLVVMSFFFCSFEGMGVLGVVRGVGVEVSGRG